MFVIDTCEREHFCAAKCVVSKIATSRDDGDVEDALSSQNAQFRAIQPLPEILRHIDTYVRFPFPQSVQQIQYVSKGCIYCTRRLIDDDVVVSYLDGDDCGNGGKEGIIQK